MVSVHKINFNRGFNRYLTLTSITAVLSFPSCVSTKSYLCIMSECFLALVVICFLFRAVNWAVREAFLEIERREKNGLPLVDPELIPVEKIKSQLPSDEELGDTDIII